MSGALYLGGVMTGFPCNMHVPSYLVQYLSIKTVRHATKQFSSLPSSRDGPQTLSELVNKHLSTFHLLVPTRKKVNC